MNVAPYDVQILVGTILLVVCVVGIVTGLIDLWLSWERGKRDRERRR